MRAAVFTLTLLASLSAAGKYVVPTAREILTAEESFRYLGDWISPVIVKTFITPAADVHLPTVTAIDVAAATGSTRFFGKFTTEDEGHWVTAAVPGGKFSYRWHGRTDAGRHVVQVVDSTEGSLINVQILVFKISSRQGWNEQGKPYQRVWLELERSIHLGDRANARITIDKETVIANIEYKSIARQNEMKVYKLD